MRIIVARAWRVLTKRRGSPQWDIVIRTTGALAALAIWPTTVWPEVGELVGFALITIFVNGPLSPFLPATYEPLLMLMARSYAPVLVAFVGIMATLYIEYLNYHLYRAALLHPTLNGFRRKRLIRRVIVLFKRSPFLAVWLCAWSPLPYWVVRILAPLAKYPVGPYLLATFLGRFPRLWFFAAIGLVIPVPTGWLVGIATIMAGVGIAVAAHRRATRPAVAAPATPIPRRPAATPV
jgi:membrane protein YqaA with SNARE-associated domain